MIKFLRIRNLATIEDLSLDLEDGFSILTGETGAGKSIIIDSIRLLMGEKGSPDLIRTGMSESVVEAVFRPDEATPIPPDIPASEGELCVQRQVSQQGPGKAYLGGVLVPLKRLKEAGQELVDIYGQHDHVFLLDLDNHLDFLDGFAGTRALRLETARQTLELRKLLREVKDIEAAQRDAARRLEFLEFQIREIEAAGLKPGEEEDLLRERHILRNAQKISELVGGALDLAYDREDSLSSLLARLRGMIEELMDFDPAWREARDSIEHADITLRETADLLRKYQERQSASPDRLEALEERLSLVEKLKRKYGRNLTEIEDAHLKLVEERDRMVHGQERMAVLSREIDDHFGEYVRVAGLLSQGRKKSGRELEGMVEKEIALLGMRKARFQVEVRTTDPSRDQPDKLRDSGLDDVEFLISPNPGEQVRPLRKIASGGELSRVMLALKSLGRDQGASKTLIFDEIDAGIGGRTADSIALKLRDLARRHQVVCITHLPQIASHARHHFHIEKSVEKNRTFTTVRRLDGQDRVREIARLIAGSHITPAALENAREMLDHNLGSSPKA